MTPPELYSKVVFLRHEGHTNREIAEMLGQHADYISNVVRRGRERGDIPPFEPTTNRRTFGDVRIGKAVNMLNQLPPEIALWVRQQVPKNGTVMDLLGAMITDAYHEERSDD